MFLIAPLEESTGDAVMSVENAKKQLAKIEAANRVRPNLQNALSLACVHYTLGNGELALHAIDKLAKIVPSLNGEVSPQAKAIILLNRGMFLRGFGRFAEARKDILAAREMDKHSAYIAMAAAEEYLRDGAWDKAWWMHNQSRGTVEGAALGCGLPQSSKYWDGHEVPKHLLVINEGGAGDRINYTRWLPILTQMGIDWSFFCFDELAPFYERLPWIGKDRLIRETEKREFSPPPSHWTTTFSLPAPLNIRPEQIPAYPTPYTAPEHDFHFKKTDDLPMVGLCWSANELFQGGLKVRSLTEGQAMRLVCLTAHKVHWVNLQHGHKMPYPVLNLPFETWEDTSVALSALDGLVTVDCGTLWLSVAMEKQTACLLTSSEDWKFAHNWGKCLTKYHNGPSEQLFDAEKAIDKLILDIREGKWPIR